MDLRIIAINSYDNQAIDRNLSIRETKSLASSFWKPKFLSTFYAVVHD